MLSVKPGGIKYHFFSLRYVSTYDWTPVSGTIGEHSTHKANDVVKYQICLCKLSSVYTRHLNMHLDKHTHIYLWTANIFIIFL